MLVTIGSQMLKKLLTMLMLRVLNPGMLRMLKKSIKINLCHNFLSWTGLLSPKQIYIEAFEARGYFPQGHGRFDQKTVPEPRPDEVVVFAEYFEVGLRFPCHESLSKILGKYNL